MFKPNRKIRALLLAQNWEEMSLRLLESTDRRYGWQLRSIGYQPQDVVQEAIASVFEGRRRWKLEVDLYVFLLMTIKSIVSHLVDKANIKNGDDKNQRKRRTTRLSALSEKVTQEQFESPSLDKERILRFMKDDELACKIVELKASDYDLAPRDIAIMLEIDVKDVYKANERIKKKLHRLFAPPAVSTNQTIKRGTDNVR